MSKLPLLTLCTLSLLPTFLSANSSKAERCEKDATNTHVSADFLYWKADIGGSNYGTYVTYTDGGRISNRKIQQLEGEWKPGFRVGLGYKFWDDKCDLSLTWTRFHDESKHKSISADGNPNVIKQSWSNIIGANATKATGHWNLKLNTLDLDIGKNYCISNSIKLYPYIGARAAWFKHDYRSTYLAFARIIDYDNNLLRKEPQPTGFRGNLKYAAGGLHLGSKATKLLGNHFSIAANVSGSLLYGNFDINERFNEISVSKTKVVSNIRYYYNELKGLRTNIDAFVGLQWDSGDCLSKANLALSIGYEMSKWFRLNELFSVDSFDTGTPLGQDPSGTPQFRADFSPTEHSKAGDLDLQGLTIKASLSF